MVLSRIQVMHIELDDRLTHLAPPGRRQTRVVAERARSQRETAGEAAEQRGSRTEDRRRAVKSRGLSNECLQWPADGGMMR